MNETTDMITGLTDGDIRTEWDTGRQAIRGDEDAADDDQDAVDADEDATDSQDADATDSHDADGTDA